MVSRSRFLAKLMVIVTLISVGSSKGWAEAVTPWQIGLQQAASPVMMEIHSLNDYLTLICVLIVAFVLALLGYVCLRFNEKANPTPSKTTHNTTLEVIWTVIPVVILISVGIPSLKLLFFMDKTHEPDMTLKVSGHQWYWSYEYPGHGDLGFDALMVEDDELEEGQLRLLSTDEEVVLPVGKNIRVLLTSEDVIHAWALPQFGVKIDTVPGRTNETWLRINEEGVYYGQCSELCGVNHGFMPIKVRAVSTEAFSAWVEKAQEEYARVEPQQPPAMTVAQNEHVSQPNKIVGE